MPVTTILPAPWYYGGTIVADPGVNTLKGVPLISSDDLIAMRMQGFYDLEEANDNF